MIKYTQTVEEILKRLKSGIDNVDTTEGSFIHDSQAPIAIELAQIRIDLDETINKSVISLAVKNGYDDMVVKKCEELGVFRKDGVKAEDYITVTGIAGATFPTGAKVATESGLQYILLEDALISIGQTKATARIQAEQIGSTYNVSANTITKMPIKYNGIISVTNLNVIDSGVDVESITSLYQRYLLKAKTPAISGNKYHYEQWALEVTGVGSATCIPGAGNVKVIISNSNKRAASEELIQKVYDHIDSERPILAGILTIESVKEKTINIIANVEIDSSVILGNIQSIFSSIVEEYLNNGIYSTKKISIAKLGGLLVDIDGVVDYSGLKLNNGTSNISLADEEIAVLGSITLGVI